MMANKKHGTIYTGSTDDIYRRPNEHQLGMGSVFTKRHGLDKCVYIEICPTTAIAIRMERRYKKYNRQWKIDLIESINPNWDDLSLKLNELL